MGERERRYAHAVARLHRVDKVVVENHVHRAGKLERRRKGDLPGRRERAPASPGWRLFESSRRLIAVLELQCLLWGERGGGDPRLPFATGIEVLVGGVFSDAESMST